MKKTQSAEDVRRASRGQLMRRAQERENTLQTLLHHLNRRCEVVIGTQAKHEFQKQEERIKSASPVVTLRQSLHVTKEVAIKNDSYKDSSQLVDYRRRRVAADNVRNDWASNLYGQDRYDIQLFAEGASSENSKAVKSEPDFSSFKMRPSSVAVKRTIQNSTHNNAVAKPSR